jgi:hypothetical protein
VRLVPDPGRTNAGPKAGIGRAGQEADPSNGSFWNQVAGTGSSYEW